MTAHFQASNTNKHFPMHKRTLLQPAIYRCNLPNSANGNWHNQNKKNKSRICEVIKGTLLPSFVQCSYKQLEYVWYHVSWKITFWDRKKIPLISMISCFHFDKGNVVFVWHIGVKILLQIPSVSFVSNFRKKTKFSLSNMYLYLKY